VRLAGQLVTSLKEGEMSDDEEQEGGRMLDIIQQLLGMSNTMSERHKQKVSELLSRSGLSQMRPSMPMGGMPGMMAGAGYAQYQQMYQQQPGYPGMPAGYPGGYPSQKMRLLAGQGASPAPPQPEPPKPVVPLKNLCQFPLPGAIEGVGSVTVTLEDFKTLQVGTFLNDVIIDFYMKYIQFTKFSEQDKNRVHIFTTFWFSRLTNKPSPIEARKDPVQRRYDRVKRWTRKVNIFEKDFIVVPINENYHWYLCIICYPGMVGCKDMGDDTSCATPARQKNRRRKKDKIKVLKEKMNAQPRKDESDERDEPLASEDEVEHEDDSTDVELWKSKLVDWEKQEVIRKEEEKKRMIELERQKREWEQRRREYEEQQRKLYEEQQRLFDEEQLRLAMEQEEMGEEEENWDDGEKYDEDGNPVEDKYDEYGELITERYDEFGEPLHEEAMDESEELCENGGFADAAKYTSSVEMGDAAGAAIPVKARAMAADWDDWGEEDEDQEEEAMEHDSTVIQKLVEEQKNIFSSFASHTVDQSHSTLATSMANQLLTTKSVVSLTLSENVMDTADTEVEELKCLSSMVSHTVSWTQVSEELHIAAIAQKLELNRNALAITISEDVKVIPQMDGIVDEDGSDEENGEAVAGEKEVESEDEKKNVADKCKELENKGETCEKPNMSPVVADATVQDENGEPDESSMSADDEITMKLTGLVGYADTGDDTDTEVDSSADPGQNELQKSREVLANDTDESYEKEELPIDEENVVIKERADMRDVEDKENSIGTMDVNYDSSDTEDYEGDDAKEKHMESNLDERHSDSEIEEVEVAEKESEYDDQDKSEDPSDRSESESDMSDSEDEDEDISRDVPVKQPCILVFDSLGGRKERQARLCATLRDFLALEYQEKYPGQTREFSARTIPGAAPRVPQQPNLTDCGLFLCHNVETFFSKPVEDYTMPITSLSSWFPDSESRMKRRNVADIVKKLAREQNQDKLEQLQLPDLVFVEPERSKPSQRTERGNSPGSDGDNMDDYNSEDDYDDDDEEQEKSDRYSSSPNSKNRVTSREKDDRFSTEDEDNSEDTEEKVDKSGRRQKRYRSDDSGSDEDRRRRHQKKRNERATSSESDRSEDDFDSSAVYGRQTQKPETNLNFNSSPMKRLPPGISISRAADSNSSRGSAHVQENQSQEQPEITRRLPPGISISRTLNNPPSGLSISREKSSPPVARSNLPVVRQTIIRDEDEFDDPNDVTIEDVSDCSDDCDIFDMDEPSSKRTFLSPNSATPNKDKVVVTERLFNLPPGVSISRGGVRSEAEDMSESEHDDEDMRNGRDEEMDDLDVYKRGSMEDDKAELQDDLILDRPASMVAHQAGLASIESFAVSMVAHQIFIEQRSVSVDNVPQLDGMNDIDSEDENNETPAESAPVNQELQAEEQNDDNPDEPTEELNDPGQEENLFVQELSESVEANKTVTDEGPSVDDVDNIDNHGLEEGEEIFPPESSTSEDQEEIKTGEEFQNETFDDESNLQNAEEIDELTLGDPINAQENYAHGENVNLPTEEAMDTYDDSDLENGAEDTDDHNGGVEDIGECAEVLDGALGMIGDEETVEGEDEVLDTSGELIEDEAEVIDDSTEVYDDDDVDALDNNQEEYGYEDGEEEDMYEEEDNYSYGYSQPPIKRARMSPEAEVVLDSGDEDDSPAPSTSSRPNPMPAQQNSSIHSQILAQQQAMLLAQQAQLRSSYQPGQQHSRALPPGLSMSRHQPYAQQQQQQQQPSRKRKLESQALCIKDGQVYLKPFAQLPPALLGQKPAKPQQHNNKPNPTFLNPSKPNPLYTNQYKPIPPQGRNAYQPVLSVHQMSSQAFPRLGRKEDDIPSVQQRIRQLPPGIMVQRSDQVREERRGSVEDQEDQEYQSDEPEEIMDGQEADEDLDIIEEQSNKDIYSEDEESFDEAAGANEQEETYEDENSKESNSDHEEILVTNEEGKENKNSADVEFEESSVDVQEACEVNDKPDEEFENSPQAESEHHGQISIETSEKQSDLIEGEEVADCDESQKEVGGEDVLAPASE